MATKPGGSSEPQPGRCGAKLRNSVARWGEVRYCTNKPKPDRRRCRYHGGNSPRAHEASRFKHGRYSQHMPTRLLARYSQALADAQLTHLGDEIALVDTRLAELVEGLGETGHPDLWGRLNSLRAEFIAASRGGNQLVADSKLVQLLRTIEDGQTEARVWAEIIRLTEQRRRLVESERKRMVETEQMIQVNHALALVKNVMDTVTRHVSERDTLVAIRTEIGLLLGPGGPDATA